jgi:short-subunit dehydrogenase
MNAYAGKKIWLIGASEGIGRALAMQLASSGAVLALSARNAARLDELRAQCGGAEHGVVPCDVTNLTSVQDAWNFVHQAWGIPDIIIYNCGTYEPMPAQKFNLQQAEGMLDVNFRGALRVLSLILPEHIKAAHGHLVFVGSVAGYRGLPDAMGYGASKSALIHLAENLMCDLKPFGIRTQIVNPGFVETRLTHKNSFAMPGIISAEKAAGYIVKGMQSPAFQISFPWLFVLALKLLRLLPAWLYFELVGAKKKS